MGGSAHCASRLSGSADGRDTALRALWKVLDDLATVVAIAVGCWCCVCAGGAQQTVGLLTLIVAFWSASLALGAVDASGCEMMLKERGKERGKERFKKEVKQL